MIEIAFADSARVGRTLLRSAQSRRVRGFVCMAVVSLVSMLNKPALAIEGPAPTPTQGSPTIYESNFKGNTVQAFSLLGTNLGVFCAPASPTGVAIDLEGNVYVASDKPGGYSILKFSTDGSNSIFADTDLKGPHALIFDRSGNLYVTNAVSDTIVKFTADGVGTVFADATAGLNNPVDMAFDAAGNLFVTNAYGGPMQTGSVLKFDPNGTGSVFAESGFRTAYGIAIDSTGNIYVSNFDGNTVEKFSSGGTDLGVFISSALQGPHGMIFDGAGNLYVANNGTCTIEEFSSTGAYLGVFASTDSGPHFLTLSTAAPTPSPAPPSITGQPSSLTVTVGQTATFTVRATGSAPLSYQWRKNGVNINRATKATYKIATTSSDDGAVVSVVVQNAFGNAISDDAILTVKTPPIITMQPADVAVTVGGTATFSVTVKGQTPFRYQWKKDRVDIDRATKSSYTTPPATLGDNGSRFAVVVTNSLGSATSDEATLTVQ